MTEPEFKNQDQSAYFARLYADVEFWSCCGVDGLAIAFDFPLETIRALHEYQRLALMRLLRSLATGNDEFLFGLLGRLAGKEDSERLKGLIALGA